MSQFVSFRKQNSMILTDAHEGGGYSSSEAIERFLLATWATSLENVKEIITILVLDEPLRSMKFQQNMLSVIETHIHT